MHVLRQLITFSEAFCLRQPLLCELFSTVEGQLPITHSLYVKITGGEAYECAEGFCSLYYALT